ncbi:putative transcriptional regulator [Plesiocystis pacifica SIR-1]|uniref:Putative transcriptional regulator n=1 Tax=Plesiocystis pacifica SIR-1 TaxID=391625 RepID=A6GGE6_9BACT|nr:helix-turn-helix transcriptional regulator [Plesiocystis pacifica]EDM75067.1 putative transcriptional regulator [Plesiocystis pacifica SIR-1]
MTITNASAVSTAPAFASNEVHIRVARDEDAARISAVLEALGYSVLRQLDEGDGPARLRWAVTRLAQNHKLTDREQDILEFVLRGRNNEQIGRELSISRATVKWHMHNIFAKTNTGNREALLRLALQLGNGGNAMRRPAAPSTPAAGPAQPVAKSSASGSANWAGSEEVTARIDFDQPRVPSAESVPSKRLF